MTDVFATGSLRDCLSHPFRSRDWFNRFLVGTALHGTEQKAIRGLGRLSDMLQHITG